MIDFLLKVKELFKKEPTPQVKYTEEELMIRLKVFIGGILALTLFGIVFVVLFSLIFVTQPLNAMSPIDQKFFELIIPIATFLTGTLSGIMLAGGDKDAQAKALEAANKGWERPPTPPAPAGRVISAPGTGGFGSGFSAPSMNNGPSAGGWGAVADSFAAPAMDLMGNFASSFNSEPATVVTAKNGKPAPIQPDHPEI